MSSRPIFRKLDMLHTPTVASAGAWREWELKMRTQRPIRWFVQRTIPNTTQKVLLTTRGWGLSLIDFLKGQFFKHYRQPRVRTGLPPGDHAAEDRLLGACFTLLCEVLHDYPNPPYGAWAKWRAAGDPVFKEGITLFWWWSSRDGDRARKLPAYPELPEDVITAPEGVWTESHQFNPAVKAWKKIHSERERLNEAFLLEDRQMLARAIAVFPDLVQGSQGRATPRKRYAGPYSG